MKREDYISDEQVVKRANAAVKIELDKKKAMEVPIAVYDRKSQSIYQVNSDGTRIELMKTRGDVIVKEGQKKPEIVVFAGPNGSGNGTFYRT